MEVIHLWVGNEKVEGDLRGRKDLFKKYSVLVVAN